jgi:uncharacterized damage-inducible protein DinB
MARTVRVRARDLRRGMEEAYVVNERINQLLLEQLDPRAWHEQLPGCKGRSIASIFAHLHNVRCKWIRLSAPHLKPLPLLDRRSHTQQQVKRALAKSAALCSRMLAEALADQGQLNGDRLNQDRLSQNRPSQNKVKQGRVTRFHRDGWARPWPPGAAMFAYMMTHEAHHRGQVCMLAHQLGFRLPNKVTSEMWGWEKLWKECGFGPVQ